MIAENIETENYKRETRVKGVFAFVQYFEFTEWDLAEWLERLIVNAVVATVLGSIPASSDSADLRGGLWNSVENITYK